ncbi:MAG: hypothetical protein K1X94_19560 [Sandaracinaceae bacterium]|jgi:hypothetical protein|nr:hypothetical protein [Sandaracinaceae bacterium]
MNRRSVLAVIGLAPALVTTSALADEVSPPAARLVVTLETRTYTGTPTAVALWLMNPTAEPVILASPRLIASDVGVRVPLEITRYELAEQARSLHAPFTLAAERTVHARFTVASFPAGALASGHIDLSLRFLATSESSFSMRRA